MSERRKRRPWRQTIDGQFAPRRIEMLESPAYRVLSLWARKALDRIEIELAHHGGNDNGKLPCTYDDFAAYGIRRHQVAPALREVEALGFVTWERGRAGNADFRTPGRFGLIYRHFDKAKPTDEWKRISTIEEAEKIARAAREPLKKLNRVPVTFSAQSQCRTPSLKTKIPSAARRHYSHSAETVTTIDISGAASPTADLHPAKLPWSTPALTDVSSIASNMKGIAR